MGSTYNLAVHMSFSAMGLAAAATGAIAIFKRLESAAMAASGGVTALTANMRALFLAGGLITGGAVLGVGAISVFVHAASTMQDAITKVGAASVGTNAQLTQLQATAYATASKTQFSAPQVLGMAAVAATAGVNNRATLNAVLPTLANAAEVDYRMRGIAPQESVQSSVALAHMFGAFPAPGKQARDVYTGKETSSATAFKELVDLFARSQLVSGATPQTMVNRLSYMMPAVQQYGLTAQSAIAFTSLAQNMGLARSGAGLNAIFAALAPALSGHGNNAHNADMQQLITLGGGNWGKIAAGGVNMIPELMTTLMRARENMKGPDAGALFTALENGAFGRAGARSLAVLGSPQAMQRYSQIQGLLGNPNQYKPGADNNTVLPSSEVFQQQLNQTWTGQSITLRTNFQSLAAIIGMQLLPPLTALVGVLNHVVAGLVSFAQQHPMIVRFGATFLLVSTAIAAVVGPLMMISSLVGLFVAALGPAAAVIATTAGAMVALDLSMLPVTAVVLAIVAVIALAVTIFLNWHTITQTVGSALTRFGGVLGSLASGAISGLRNAVLGLVSGAFGLLNGAITWLNTHIPLASQVIALMISPITTIIGAFGHWHQAVTLIQHVFETLQGPLRVVQTFISNMTTGIEGLVSQFGQLVQHVLQLASGPAGQVISALGQAWSAASSAAQSVGSAVGSTVQHTSIAGAQTLHTVHDPLPHPALHHHLHPITAHHTAAHHETHHHAVSHQQHIHSGAIHVTVNGAGLDTGGATASATAAALHALRKATTHETQHGTVRSRGGTPHLRTPVPHR